jgi:hypothetical protein
MIYQNYYLVEVPSFVFQKHDKSWFKRKKGSRDAWVLAPFNEQSALQDKFGHVFLYKYNVVFKLALLGGLIYAGYKGRMLFKGQSASTKSNSPT